MVSKKLGGTLANILKIDLSNCCTIESISLAGCSGGGGGGGGGEGVSAC